MSRALKARLHKLEAEHERRHPPRHETKAEWDARWAAWLKEHPYWHELTFDEQNTASGILVRVHHIPGLTAEHVEAALH